MNEDRIERLACELADELGGDEGDELMVEVMALMRRAAGRQLQAQSWKSYAVVDGAHRLRALTGWQRVHPGSGGYRTSVAINEFARAFSDC